MFELDNTLMKTAFKKTMICNDTSTYIKVFGQQSFKLYISYRSYMIELLRELKKDFEVILFTGSNSYEFISKVADVIEKENEPYFEHLIC